ncbi:MAG: hypothetical protein H8E90_00860 [Anaerolineales bacterium]|nr:hypothetical protein [Anaerolineales bacterium]
MKSKTIARMLLVAGMTALLLASSAAGLAVGQSLAFTADSPCDNVCVDQSCVPVPVEWLGAIPITDTFIIYPTSACLCENQDGSFRVEGEANSSCPTSRPTKGQTASTSSSSWTW